MYNKIILDNKIKLKAICLFQFALLISVAFCTVDHNTVCKVVQTTFGVSESSMVQNRMAEVHINVSKSQLLNLEFSVLQRSICRSVLYTVYASTLQQFIKESGVSLLCYADDHSAYDSFNPKIFEKEKRVI